jgi:hypothetical protein
MSFQPSLSVQRAPTWAVTDSLAAKSTCALISPPAVRNRSTLGTSTTGTGPTKKTLGLKYCVPTRTESLTTP